MSSIPEIAQEMRTVLTEVAEAAGRPTGFVQRESKLTASLFAQTTVFGWWEDPQASLEALSQVAASLGLDITPQGIHDRFSPEAAALLKTVLEAAVSRVIATQPVAIPLLGRFSAVILQDSSVINLPDGLELVWKGCGDGIGHHRAALKIQVRLDLLTGNLHGPLLENGRNHDRSSLLQEAPLPKGALRIADLGYFNLELLRSLDDQGVFFLSRLQANTVLFDEEGHRLDLLHMLEASSASKVASSVQIGLKEHLPGRLLAVRVPQEVADQRRRRLKEEGRRRGQNVSRKALALASWTILVTNVPEQLLSLAEALVLARVRWQVELLFKLWKQHGQIDEWRTEKEERILCEIYAKLTAMVIQHWLLLVTCWSYPDRSLVKAAKTIRSHVPLLIAAMVGSSELTLSINQIGRCLAVGCRMNRRKVAPNAYQLLLNPLEVA